MSIATIIALFALALSVIVNICIVAYNSGKMSATLMFLGKLIKEYKEETKQHFERLEAKQDKHNNLIERMVKVEESVKSAHKRINDRG